jgi:hypothetical protein
LVRDGARRLENIKPIRGRVRNLLALQNCSYKHLRRCMMKTPPRNSGNHPEPLIVAEDARTPVKVQHSTEYGAPGIDVRKYYHPKGSDELAPTPNGARVPEEDYGAFALWVLKEATGATDEDISAIAELLLNNGAEDIYEKWLPIFAEVQK